MCVLSIYFSYTRTYAYKYPISVHAHCILNVQPIQHATIKINYYCIPNSRACTYVCTYIHVYKIDFLTFLYVRTCACKYNTHSAILDILDIVGLCSAECSLQFLDLLIKATKSKEQLLLVRTYVHLLY